jgi:hypothetical protein
LKLIYESCRAILHGIALLISNYVSVQSKSDSRVAMSQLPLHNGRSCTVRKQCTSRPVSQAVESGTRDAESIEQRMKLFLTQLVRAEWSATPNGEKQFALAVTPAQMGTRAPF